jgi:hypothetical protein
VAAAARSPPRRALARRWWIVPLTALLTNVHLYAFLVPICVGALWLGAIWEHRAARRYALLTLLTALASLMTPMLRGTVRTILHYQFADAMVAGPVIAEMQPIWHGGAGILCAAIILAVVGCAIWRRERLRIGERLWILIGVLLVLQLGRYAPLFALLAVPTLAATMPALSDRLLGRPLVYGMIAPGARRRRVARLPRVPGSTGSTGAMAQPPRTRHARLPVRRGPISSRKASRRRGVGGSSTSSAGAVTSNGALVIGSRSSWTVARRFIPHNSGRRPTWARTTIGRRFSRGSTPTPRSCRCGAAGLPTTCGGWDGLQSMQTIGPP